jgi:hypothetical protein
MLAGRRSDRSLSCAPTALRTRRPKAEAKLETLRGHWREEAKALGFALRPEAQRAAQQTRRAEDRAGAARTREMKSGTPATPREPKRDHHAAAINQSSCGSQKVSRTAPAPALSPGLAPSIGSPIATAASASAPSRVASATQLSPAQIGSLLGTALLSLGPSSSMAGLRVPLRDRAGERGESRKHGRAHSREYEAE